MRKNVAGKSSAREQIKAMTNVVALIILKSNFI